MSKPITFRDKEKARYKEIKNKLFSPEACKNGTYTLKGGNSFPVPFYLNDNNTDENIFYEFRNNAIDYFKNRDITWHRSSETILPEHKPDNHLCCSQSFCVNTLFYFIDKPKELSILLNQIGYPSKEVLPFYLDNPFDKNIPHYICFEWFGARNYLFEMRDGKILKDEERKRGKGCTNADFAIRFKDKFDKIQIILGEWKYTEYYDENNKISLRGKKYRNDKIYNKSLENTIYKIESPTSDILDFYDEPIYQLMRLQLLSQKMQIKNEMGAEKVSLLLTVPKANNDYKESFYSDKMVFYKTTGVMNFWENIVGTEYFKYIYTEDLLKYINDSVGQNNYTNYLNVRYKW